ncbi:sulfite exporter TauE/SafE family protein [Streptomyces sp. NBC_00038]|uniref:urease accessory protein UreH domain-containing protein n=1 Tax=Streptomyces sp. NBC_00038 TaxID=2903615 RepID=UPI00224C91E1|nr:sulfite exporter TauE/SafE family protein [Streptomyces sp. NBC_00038]MCX5556481.1 sulfite exporter TauE/SafE family protein [Streptomyces sp. NBC_00038]
MTRTLRRALGSCAAVLTAACALVLVPSGHASAHPLGNFTVNRYDGLVVAPGQLRVDHVEDLAEIPATQAEPQIKKLGMTDWARERCETAARDSEVTVGGNEVPLTVGTSVARVRPGQAGLNTLRVECRLTAALPEQDTVDVGFRGAGAEKGPGWREITARGDRMTLAASDVPKESVSRQLTEYPQELLSSPADTASASLRVRAGGPALVEDGRNAPADSVLPRGADRWTQALDSLVARHDLTIGFAALALLIAVGLGALHALAPGHGKTLMAATAAARGGRAGLRDVLPLAASVTVTHTLGVVALGLLITAGSAAAPSVIAWLGVTSGLLVTLAGATLVRRAWRNRAPGHGHGHPHGGGHTHDHDHGHAHSHADGHAHDHEHGDAHDHGHAHPDHPHDHEHAEQHERPLVLAHAHASAEAAPHHKPHTHQPAPAPALAPKAKRTPRPLEHTHGGFTHTHAIAPTVRGTILLGFAGGLVPSPSAVVVLVGAAALGQAWFGLLLVLAYGVGLALTLTAAGFAVVKLGDGVTRALARRPRLAGGPVVALLRRTAPLGSALVVVALGAGLVFRGAASVLG